VESDIRDNPAMTRLEMPLSDGALADAYYKVENGRVVLLHTEVPQELSGMGYGSRLAHGVFRSVATRREKSDREVTLHVFLRRPTHRVRRTPRWLIEDGGDLAKNEIVSSGSRSIHTFSNASQRRFRTRD
jgi:hypothetical protein